MLLSLNRAKSSFRFVFETEAAFNKWYEERAHEYEPRVTNTRDAAVKKYALGTAGKIEIAQTWVVVVEMRKYFRDLLTHYHSQANADFYADFFTE